MSKRRSTFEPSQLDFELRAIALRDYQRIVLGLDVPKERTSSDKLFDKRHFLWLLSEILNIAYMPFWGQQVELRGDRYEWLPGTLLNPTYEDCMRHANLIFDELQSGKELIERMKTFEKITRRGFLTSIASVSEKVLKDAPLRTKIPELQSSCVSGTSVWSLVIRDENGFAPWIIPGLCRSTKIDIKNHRLRILLLLDLALNDDISNFEHSAQMTEFGTPRISLIKLANRVHAIDADLRDDEMPIKSKFRVQPAEVGTIIDQIQKRLGINNRRHFLHALKGELDIQRRDSVELDKIDEYFFKSK